MLRRNEKLLTKRIYRCIFLMLNEVEDEVVCKCKSIPLSRINDRNKRMKKKEWAQTDCQIFWSEIKVWANPHHHDKARAQSTRLYGAHGARANQPIRLTHYGRTRNSVSVRVPIVSGVVKQTWFSGHLVQIHHFVRHSQWSWEDHENHLWPAVFDSAVCVTGQPCDE